MRLTRFVIYVLFGAVMTGFTSLYIYLDKGIEPQTLQATEEAMVDKVHFISALIENEIKDGEFQLTTVKKAFKTAHAHEFNAKIYKKTKNKIGTNFYVTNAEGIVLYDSSDLINIGEDYSLKRDVYHTLKGNYGARSTRSEEGNPKTSTMFIAAPIQHEGKIIGVISLSKSKTDVLSFIEGRRKWIIISLILIAFGICSFTIAVFFWVFRPLGIITTYARGIRDGERPVFPKLGKGREVNTLGGALKEMHDSLEDRKYLESYVQMLTHELKSPLSAIQGAAELLNEEMPREHREKFLKNIRVETERSRQIIDGLLKLSKLESLKHLENKEFFEISTILNQVVDAHSSAIRQQQHDIQLDTLDHHTCHGDSLSIQAAISNMLQNAIDFSSKGSTIHLTSEMNNTHLTVTVRDHGPGVPDYATERVFENFYSLARPGTNKKSSGLGLAFVREVANLHQGKATLVNHPDGGAVVKLTLKK